MLSSSSRWPSRHTITFLPFVRGYAAEMISLERTCSRFHYVPLISDQRFVSPPATWAAGLSMARDGERSKRADDCR